MTDYRADSTIGREKIESGQAPEDHATSRDYQSPDLRLIGGTELIQGRNSYDGKDKGNDNYYV